MAERATLNPPYLFSCLFILVFGGFSQVRWPKGPPYLALNPPYFLFIGGVFFSFLCLFLVEKPVFP